jgi:hypothetical protein
LHQDEVITLLRSQRDELIKERDALAQIIKQIASTDAEQPTVTK